MPPAPTFLACGCRAEARHPIARRREFEGKLFRASNLSLSGRPTSALLPWRVPSELPSFGYCYPWTASRLLPPGESRVPLVLPRESGSGIGFAAVASRFFLWSGPPFRFRPLPFFRTSAPSAWGGVLGASPFVSVRSRSRPRLETLMIPRVAQTKSACG